MSTFVRLQSPTMSAGMDTCMFVAATEFYTLLCQKKIRYSKKNRNQVHKLYTFSLPLALWFRLVLSVVAWIVPMSNELEKDGRNQNDPNCPWQNSFRKRNVNLSPSRASCQTTLLHASQVSTNPLDWGGAAYLTLPYANCCNFACVQKIS